MNYTDKGGGVALTPIKMPNPDNENKMDNNMTCSWGLERLSMQYAHVDGRPCLPIHCGHCCFWSSVEVLLEVVRTKPD